MHLRRNKPSPAKNVLAPPHLASIATAASPASQEPDWTIMAREPSSGMWMMSPGNGGATMISPGPEAAVNVLMKNVSPPSTERFRPPRMPPCALVEISIPPAIPVMAPASAWIASPWLSLTVAIANDGLNWMSTLSTAASSARERRESMRCPCA